LKIPNVCPICNDQLIIEHEASYTSCTIHASHYFSCGFNENNSITFYKIIKYISNTLIIISADFILNRVRVHYWKNGSYHLIKEIPYTIEDLDLAIKYLDFAINNPIFL
jgi:hypothetical protein